MGPETTASENGWIVLEVVVRRDGTVDGVQVRTDPRVRRDWDAIEVEIVGPEGETELTSVAPAPPSDTGGHLIPRVLH